jgi:hypothetical protein
MIDILRTAGLWTEQYWEHLQPNLERGPARRGRLLNCLSMLLHALQGTGPIHSQGSFVLTILARPV